MEVFGAAAAAITIALKLERMATGLATDLNDARQFGLGLEKARLQAQLETDRMKDMRILLFGLSDEKTIVSGIVFSNFDYQTQLAILNLLRHFSELLALNYKMIDSRYGAVEPSAAMILNTSLSLENFQQATWAKKLRWGLRDKKKVDKLLQELQSWNDRLFSRIQISLIRMAVTTSIRTMPISSPATMVAGSTFLDEIPEAQRLGLVNDTKMLQFASNREPGSLLNLRDDGLKDCLSKQANDGTQVPWDLAKLGGASVLLEYKDFLPDLQDKPMVSSEQRVKQLANMLHSSKSERYHMLSCRGFFLERQQFVLVFDIPDSDRSCSISSLYQDLKTRRKPSLEDRFGIAKTLAASMSQLFATGWVHKSFRSGNILYFSDPYRAEDLKVCSLSDLGISLGTPSFGNISTNILCSGQILALLDSNMRDQQPRHHQGSWNETR